MEPLMMLAEFDSRPFRVMPRTWIRRIIGLMGYGSLAAFAGFGARDELVRAGGSDAAAAVSAVVAAAALIALVAQWVREARQRVELHREGLLIVRGRRRTSARWEEIDQVFIRMTEPGTSDWKTRLAHVLLERTSRPDAQAMFNERTTRVWIRLVLTDGRVLKLGSNERGISRGLPELLDHVVPRQAAEAQRRISAGGIVTFGKLRIGRRAVGVGGELVDFGEIDRLWEDKGKLYLKRRGKVLSKAIRTDKVPNYPTAQRLLSARIR